MFLRCLASAAAAYQASAGPMVAKGVFATLQSAGMGGYGVAAVHGATRVGAAVVGFLGVGAGVAAEAAEATKAAAAAAGGGLMIHNGASN